MSKKLKDVTVYYKKNMADDSDKRVFKGVSNTYVQNSLLLVIEYGNGSVQCKVPLNNIEYIHELESTNLNK